MAHPDDLFVILQETKELRARASLVLRETSRLRLALAESLRCLREMRAQQHQLLDQTKDLMPQFAIYFPSASNRQIKSRLNR